MLEYIIKQNLLDALKILINQGKYDVPLRQVLQVINTLNQLKPIAKPKAAEVPVPEAAVNNKPEVNK